MRRFLAFFIVLSALSNLAWATATEKENTRFPCVAGAFYGSTPKLIEYQLDHFFEKARPSLRAGEAPRLLIVPHAGYIYSGQTAAYGYVQIEGRHYDTVVLIGPYHKGAIPGASIWTEGSWNTPLGVVDVDADTAGQIADSDPSFRYGKDVHLNEHSLETQLPFLQKTLKDFKIVPILLNDPSLDNTSKLARAVADAIRGKNALVVISTDMSHYFNDGQARKMDKLALDLLQKNDEDSLRQVLASRDSEFCGAAAVLTGLEILKIWKSPPPALLNYTNTSDTTGDVSKVVGYGTLAVFAGEKEDSPAGSFSEVHNKLLTPAQEKFLLNVARESIKSNLNGLDLPYIKTDDSEMAQKLGVFVTLKKKGALRGCIGSILPSEPLVQAVQNKAIQAAKDDPRFHQVYADELKEIKIEISVLSPIKRIKNADEIVMGRDGVIIVRGDRSGVFLPQVAQETGWTKERFMSELCSQKAGLPEDAWKDAATELYTFTVYVFGEADQDKK